MRLIDADKLREYWLNDTVNEPIYEPNDVLYSIDNTPTVDAEPVVHAKWDDTEYFETTPLGMFEVCRCSNCKKEIIKSKGFKYCPHCGVKMDEEG